MTTKLSEREALIRLVATMEMFAEFVHDNQCTHEPDDRPVNCPLVNSALLAAKATLS